MSKGKRRNGQRPPTAGAVDLAAHRRPAPEALAEARQQLLNRQGLVCPCGERVRDQGIELFAVLSSGAEVVIASTTFHDRDCSQLVAALGAEPPEGTEMVCLRPAPTVVWIDEPPAGSDGAGGPEEGPPA